MNRKIKFITQSAIIAALYVVITLIGAPLASGTPQVRFSEAMCVLPVFTTAAIPGLTIGCAIYNFVFAGSIYDAIFGSAATLIGAVLTYLLKKISMKRCLGFLATVPPIISNTVVIPIMLAYTMNVKESIPVLAFWVFLGEVISCGVLGTLLLLAIKKYGKHVGI